ncbi:hypothetical protein AVEN_110566-1 [Araneus ventricosus]|uniref:Chitin-binding type-2 domain-containing protein n=1 Tax=Araneus ventricosus TaxID=182803 RepID=A0A4Y2RK11_ARAVE|nr:hypothetical protein AVEN_110566-1 [Araneus ventricosus]
MKHSTSYCFFWVMACITILFLDTPNPSSAQDGNIPKLAKYFRSVTSTVGYLHQNDSIISNEKQQNKILIQQGITMPFCNMFGCEMGDTKSPKCDPGYKWDTSFNRCREIL